MPLSDEQVRDNDRRFLRDFLSLGAAVHRYTAIGLYHEAQRIPSDQSIKAEDGPYIQTSLRAKIFAEAVASMETVGKLAYAVRNRRSDGIACRYVRGTEAHSENGLRLFRQPRTHLLSALDIPMDASLPSDAHESALAAMSTSMHLLYLAYLAPAPSGREGKQIVEAYRAIKHGSNLVADPRTVSIWPRAATKGHVWMLTKWPLRAEGNDQLDIKEIGMSQDSVLSNIEMCKLADVMCKNLCQLVIYLLDAGSLPY